MGRSDRELGGMQCSSEEFSTSLRDSHQHMPTLRVLRVLELLAHSQEGMSLSELSVQSDYPKTTLGPILKTLQEYRYLCFHPENRRYTVGPQAFMLGSSYRFKGDILDIVQDQMQELVKRCNEICHLGVLSGQHIVYLKKFMPLEPVELISVVGKRLPAYATALGKALLQDHSYSELKELFPEPMEVFTSKTLASVKELYEDIHKDEHLPFAFEHEEISDNTSCVALPIRYGKNIVAAMSISYRGHKSAAELEHIKEQLFYAVHLIEKIEEVQEGAQ